jgi:hypothetical protein
MTATGAEAAIDKGQNGQVHCGQVDVNDNDQQRHDDDDYFQINNGYGGY